MPRALTVHLKEIKYEFLKALRMPQYSLPTLLFPVVFYFFFGVLFGSRNTGAVSMAKYLVVTYGAFGVIGTALFGFGTSVAVERGQGWLELKRTTPMPISAYFVSKVAMGMIFSAIIVVMLFVTGRLGAHVVLTPVEMLSVFAVLVAGSTAFCTLGLAIGFIAGPNSAAPIVNLVYLPMGFLSGLWIPIMFLPESLQSLAMWLPPYHLGQLALRVIGASNREPVLFHVGILVATTVLFGALAYAGYRRDEGKTYG